MYELGSRIANLKFQSANTGLRPEKVNAKSHLSPGRHSSLGKGTKIVDR
ncbi:hypothetical protein BRCON_1515 [Candidatus Sumerlaea chitinivorans]|uniref:Uncharacterized protein n=1 Tax=Sumerlaea chitinivorans TaxID=2250252 RepID=A0A2Z4Y6F0_SUMC1|nr:hypothetical protein BRCON_1515 [Candidatus Sumerlaea chitinivorans]